MLQKLTNVKRFVIAFSLVHGSTCIVFIHLVLQRCAVCFEYFENFGRNRYKLIMSAKPDGTVVSLGKKVPLSLLNAFQTKVTPTYESHICNCMVCKF